MHLGYVICSVQGRYFTFVKLRKYDSETESLSALTGAGLFDYFLLIFGAPSIQNRTFVVQNRTFLVQNPNISIHITMRTHYFGPLFAGAADLQHLILLQNQHLSNEKSSFFNGK